MDEAMPDSVTRVSLHRNRRPLAYDVRDLIARNLIFNNAVPPGERLPSEHELSKRYGVSRVTVRAALHGLREAGLLSIRQGHGATVLPRPAAVTHGLDRLSSIDAFAREAGQQAGSTEVDVEVRPTTPAEAERLHVAPGTTVMVIKRVKTLDDVRVAWLIDYIPEGIIDFDVLRPNAGRSALDTLVAHGEVAVEYADAEHSPVALDEETAAKLLVETGHVALFTDTVVWTATGHVADWAQVWALPEYFRFVVRRRLPFG